MQKRFYNIGAGSFKHPIWTNVDHKSDWYRAQQGSFIEWDLLSDESIPVVDDSAELVYSSHTIEHIPDDRVRNLIAEAFRILKPGGVIRLTAPDAELAHRAYVRDDRHFFLAAADSSDCESLSARALRLPRSEASIHQLFLYSIASGRSTLHSDGADVQFGDDEVDRLFAELSLTEALDHCVADYPISIQRAYPGNHMNWFTVSKITAMLSEHPFSSVFASGYGQSTAEVMRDTTHFDSTVPSMSFYVEAVK